MNSLRPIVGLSIRPALPPTATDKRQQSVVARSGTVSAPQAAEFSIPARLMLNGRSVRVGSFGVLKDQAAKRLLAAVLSPLGDVHEDAPDQAGNIGYRYRAQIPPGLLANVHDEPLHIHVQVDKNDQLKSLQVQSFEAAKHDDVQLHYGFKPLSRLETLPAEILLNIARQLPDNGRLATRASSLALQGVGEAYLSNAPSFIVAHGQTLSELGLQKRDIRLLAWSAEPRRRFVLDHGRALRQWGFPVADITALAKRPESEQQFVLQRAAVLKDLGMTPLDMTLLAMRPTAEHDFVLQHGPALQTLGFYGENIRQLARRTPQDQAFALEHGAALRALGVPSHDLSYLAHSGVAAQQRFAVQQGPVLKQAGVEGRSIGAVARLPGAERAFVLRHLAHAGVLEAAGLLNFMVSDLMKLTLSQQHFVFKYGRLLTHCGYTPLSLLDMAGQPSSSQRRILNNLGVA